MTVRTTIVIVASLIAAVSTAAADAPQPTPRLYLGSLDALSHQDFSASAAAASDTLLVVALATPLALEPRPRRHRHRPPAPRLQRRRRRPVAWSRPR